MIIFINFYGSRTLQFFAILKLFLDIENQELIKFIWIYKVGNQNNKIIHST
ncbi:unnamed protein product [Paramecium pentaurelia]|uniref:Uncharacterized protein n=1 Tax=Paramecium pentaurelia TaxID=43138 RepID=A0A8S1VZH9_9CILI|nr:unnamed protein product [Paramecium pentaurelia]